METGWIKLHRSMQDHWLWDEPRKFSKAEAWLDILLSASHKSYKTVINDNLVTCDRGEMIASVRFLQTRWKWSNTKVVRFLLLLTEEDMVSINKKTGVSVLKVSNYNDFQDIGKTKKTQKRQEKDAEKTDKRQTNDTEKTKTRMIKNNKECKEEVILPHGDNFKSTWKDWNQFRTEIKKPLTPSMVKAQIKTLAKLTETDAVMCINNSIMNGWQGLFPDKVGQQSKPQQQTFLERDQEARAELRTRNLKRIC
jgi:hypothetical protein